MTDPLSSAAATIQMLSNFMSILNAARESAQVSRDTNLKVILNKLYDGSLSLKEGVIRVTDENTELKRKIAAQTQVKPPEPEIKQGER